MGALSQIRRARFDVALSGDVIKITPASALTQNQRAFLKSHRDEIIGELRAEALGMSAGDVKKLLAYLDAIGETDQAMVDEYLTICSKDAALLAWALQWADKCLKS